MIYALIVAALSLLGAAVPLRFRFGHAQLQVYLSLAAGALLGAALFHLLPEASEHIHGDFGLPTVVGIGLVFLLQRYLAPHSHEPFGHSHSAHDSLSPSGGSDEPTEGQTSRPSREGPGRTEGRVKGSPDGHVLSEHDHVAEHAHHHHARPTVTGVVAILALSIHSFFDGVAIGAVTGGLVDAGHGGPGAPGLGHATQPLAFAVFLSVLIHKPLDGLSVSVLLLNAGTPRRRLWAIQVFYAALVPVGALAFMATRGAVAEPSTLVGYTLAFSAGTFLAIALTDLLPELHFHAHDRHKLSIALLFGLLVMWLTSLIGHAEHAHGDQQLSPAVRQDSEHNHP